MHEILLDAGTTYVLDFLNKIIASNSLGLMFSVVINVLLYKGYKSEKDYNRERDLSVTKITALMQSRLEDLQKLIQATHETERVQNKNTLLMEQLIKDVQLLSTKINP